MNIIILPPCDLDPTNHYRPGPHSLRRLATTVELLHTRPQAQVLVVGGLPNEEGLSHSSILAAYWQEHWSDTAQNIAVVNSRGLGSVAATSNALRDLQEKVPHNPDQAAVTCICQPLFHSVLRAALGELGYRSSPANNLPEPGHVLGVFSPGAEINTNPTCPEYTQNLQCEAETFLAACRVAATRNPDGYHKHADRIRQACQILHNRGVIIDSH